MLILMLPYFVLPPNTEESIGDIGLVINLQNKKMAFAVYADVKDYGEGSIALAKQLGINHNARNGGTDKKEILYIVFKESGAGQGTIPSLKRY